ncbi:hypothetical protein IWQ56_002837 [Coemansia nantahalensis]|nr:hypothetical protein IWQ56_002837 [Coemansia nantahalensis]
MTALQQLPWLVLAQVVRRVMEPGGQLRRGANEVRGDKPTEALVPLLRTCRALRAAALGQMCHAYALSVSGRLGSARGELSRWPDSVPGARGREHARLVRRVRLAVDLWSIISGRAAQVVDAQRLVLPAARTLTLSLEHSEIAEDEPAGDAGPAVRAFVGTLRAMMPCLRDVHLEHSAGYAMSRPHYREALTRQLADALADALAVPATDAVGAGMAALLLLPPPPPPRLTSIAFSWNMYHRATVQLVHNSAATLRALTVAFNHLADVGLLVADATGAAVAYPALEELRLSCWYYLEVPLVRPCTTHVPFPRLRLLALDMDYPFADDTLFRGNAETLAVLSMNVDANTIAMTRRHRLFDGVARRLGRLQHVRVKNINTSRLKPGAPARQVAEFALRLAATGAQTLTIEDITMERASVVPLLLGGDRSCAQLDSLQVLAIPDAALTLVHIAALLARLPQLVELRCHFAGLGLDPHGGDDALLRFASEHEGRARFFAVLRLGHFGDTFVENIARAAMALTIMCPRFTVPAVPSHLARPLGAAIARLMATAHVAPFQPRFAPLLSRL